MISETKMKELEAKGLHVNTVPLNFIPTKVDLDCICYFKLQENLAPLIIERFRNHESPLYPVGIQGLSNIKDNAQIGSYRKTIYDEPLANYLSKFIMSQLPDTVVTDAYSPTDTGTEETTLWKMNRVSPLFRYMEYEGGGEHYAHYDAPYVTDENTRTLFSGVMYLTTNASCGTRILLDNQDHVKFKDRKTEDFKCRNEKLATWVFLQSQENYVSIFPHGVCHDVTVNSLDKRIIIRFDIECTKVKQCN